MSSNSVKDYQGAKHWAYYVHQKIKKKYTKVEKYNETDTDLIKLFKIMVSKSVLI